MLQKRFFLPYQGYGVGDIAGGATLVDKEEVKAPVLPGPENDGGLPGIVYPLQVAGDDPAIDPLLLTPRVNHAVEEEGNAAGELLTIRRGGIHRGGGADHDFHHLPGTQPEIVGIVDAGIAGGGGGEGRGGRKGSGSGQGTIAAVAAVVKRHSALEVRSHLLCGGLAVCRPVHRVPRLDVQRAIAEIEVGYAGITVVGVSGVVGRSPRIGVGVTGVIRISPGVVRVGIIGGAIAIVIKVIPGIAAVIVGVEGSSIAAEVIGIGGRVPSGIIALKSLAVVFGTGHEISPVGVVAVTGNGIGARVDQGGEADP